MPHVKVLSIAVANMAIDFMGVKNMEIVKKGAEAWIVKDFWYGFKIIKKMRIPKRYRINELDKKLRITRTKHEARILLDAKKAGVPTPTVYFIDLDSTSIIMEHIEGSVIKDILNDLPDEKARSICKEIGRLVGRLHKHGIIHGDLTTSNMILTPEGRIVLIDFGLSEQSFDVEDRGVDLHLMKRALLSTHYTCVEECFKSIIDGYREVMGRAETEEVLRKIEEIERRGRYVSER